MPWNIEEESNRQAYLYFSTLLAAMCTILFSIEANYLHSFLKENNLFLEFWKL